MSPKARTPEQLWRARVSVPSIRQIEAVECGAACLGMVLAFHGRWVPLEELRVACGVSRDGSKASNICKAARQYGLVAKGFRKEPESLRKMPVPAIIHWNFNHYVVLEGLNESWAWINDPAQGPRRVPRQELDQAFTGVVLAFEPGDDFQASGGHPSTLVSLWRQLGGVRLTLALAAVFSLTLVLPVLAVTLLLRRFVDDVLMVGRTEVLVPLVLALLLTALMRAGNTWLQRVLLMRIEKRLTRVLTRQLFGRVLRLPMTFFDQRATAEVADRIAAPSRLAKTLSGGLLPAAASCGAIALLGAGLLAFDPLVGAAAIAAIAASSALSIAWASASRLDVTRLASARSALQTTALGVIRGAESMRANGMEAKVFAQWAGHQANILNQTEGASRAETAVAVFPIIGAGLAATAVLSLGALRVSQGHMTLGEFVAVQALAAAFLGSLLRLGGSRALFQQVTADLQRIEDVHRHSAAEPRPCAGPVHKLRGALALDRVSFGFSPLDRPFVKDFSCRVAPGKRLALVGMSGSGKTTLGRLMVGLASPRTGRILLDGQPLHRHDRDSLAASLAYVDQEPRLFEGSIRENVALWDDAIPEPVLVQALKDAAIWDDIQRRPGGLDARVAEAGCNFSGGQRQRLEIARALATEPSILVLDEATSALDPVTEASIDAALRRRGMTTVVIAHRMSTIRDSDEIIVVQNGQAIERGTHDALLAKGGAYAKLLAFGAL